MFLKVLVVLLSTSEDRLKCSCTYMKSFDWNAETSLKIKFNVCVVNLKELKFFTVTLKDSGNWTEPEQNEFSSRTLNCVCVCVISTPSCSRRRPITAQRSSGPSPSSCSWRGKRLGTAATPNSSPTYRRSKVSPPPSQHTDCGPPRGANRKMFLGFPSVETGVSVWCFCSSFMKTRNEGSFRWRKRVFRRLS